MFLGLYILVIACFTAFQAANGIAINRFDQRVRDKVSAFYNKDNSSLSYSPIIAQKSYGGISKAYVYQVTDRKSTVSVVDLQDPKLYSVGDNLESIFDTSSANIIYEYEIPISIWMTNPKRSSLMSLFAKVLKKSTGLDESSDEKSDEEDAAIQAKREVFQNRTQFFWHKNLSNQKLRIRLQLPCDTIGIGSDANSPSKLQVSPYCVKDFRTVWYEPLSVETDQQGRYRASFRFNLSSVIVPPSSVSYTAVAFVNNNSYESSSTVLLGSQQGFTVVSDIDDTIKVTQVNNKIELLKNTFVREFRAVRHMNVLYSQWAAEKPGATTFEMTTTLLPDPFYETQPSSGGISTSFHYVSGSPQPLYVALDSFLSSFNFPPGTLHLKNFTLSHNTLHELESTSTVAHKLRIISNLITRFPGRKVILVGDSTERDPETYGILARAYPLAIQCIFIRLVDDNSTNSDHTECVTTTKTCESLNVIEEVQGKKKNLIYRKLSKNYTQQVQMSRFEAAFKLVPVKKWNLFKNPQELLDVDISQGNCKLNSS